MSVKIEILIPTEEAGRGALALAERMAVLGFVPKQTLDGFVSYAADLEKKAKQHEPEPMSEWAPERIDEAIKHVEAVVKADEAVEQKKRGRPRKPAEPAPEPAAVEPTPNISAQPENRVDPEVEAQDAADEAAEVAAQPAKELTAEDLRALLGRYVTEHGMPAAQEDGVKIFADALGSPPNGDASWKISTAAASPETLAKAVAAWEAAVAKGVRYGQ